MSDKLVCPECNGRGHNMEGRTCDWCEGTGRDPEAYRDSDDFEDDEAEYGFGLQEYDEDEP
jgi:RecJ-like exonuclease